MPHKLKLMMDVVTLSVTEFRDTVSLDMATKIVLLIAAHKYVFLVQI